MLDTPQYEMVWPGSMPADMDSGEALALLLDEAPALLSVPPAEAGKKKKWANWIIPLLKLLEDHPDLEVVKPGDFLTYKTLARYRIKKGHEFRPEFINVGILEMFTDYVDEWRDVCREHQLPATTRYEIDVKGIVEFAFFAFGPKALMTAAARERHVRPFLVTTIREMNAVHRAAKGLPLLFQFSVPVVTIAECSPVGPVLPYIAGWMADSVGQVAEHVPDGCLTGCHTCLGDLGHKSKVCPRSARPVTRTANRIIRAWPEAVRPPAYMHLALAAGDIPPTLAEAYYRELRELRVPESCEIVAGFLHEGLSLGQARCILSTVEKYVGEARRAVRGGTPAPGPVRVLVAPSCGCGRRSREATVTVLRQGAQIRVPAAA